METFKIKYQVIETSFNDRKRKKYLLNENIQANDETSAKNLIKEYYVDTDEIKYIIRFL